MIIAALIKICLLHISFDRQYSNIYSSIRNAIASHTHSADEKAKRLLLGDYVT